MADRDIFAQLSMTVPKTPRIICFRPGMDVSLASYWDLSPHNMDEMRENKLFFWGGGGKRALKNLKKILIQFFFC